MGLRGDADNIVMWPEFVDSSLQLKSVRYILVEAANEEKLSYTLRTLAVALEFPDRNLVWQNFDPSHLKHLSHFYLDGSAWFLRDGFGNIIDVH